VKKIIPFLFLLVTATIACSKRDAGCAAERVDYFRDRLSIDMGYGELVNTFGEPDKDLGSGIHMYQYRLCDETSIVIGFTDRMLYARHVDKDLKVIDTIL